MVITCNFMLGLAIKSDASFSAIRALFHTLRDISSSCERVVNAMMHSLEAKGEKLERAWTSNLMAEA